MADIEEVHGFKFGSEVYPTREAAEAVQRYKSAYDCQYKANQQLSRALLCLIEGNGWEGRPWREIAEDVCDDLFPAYRERADAADGFMRSLDRAADAYEALGLAQASLPDSKRIDDGVVK